MKYLNGLMFLFFCYCISAEKAFAFSAGGLFADSVVVESMNFITADSISLHGMLYLPRHSSPKGILVDIDRPDVILPKFDFVNNSDSAGYSKKMVTHLIRSGIGVFFLAPRVPYNHENRMAIISSLEYKAQTLETIAEDAKTACLFIKKDARFTNTPVGVSGGSAMGLPAVMAAVQEKRISFVLLSSTPSTNNMDDAEYSYDRGSMNYMYLRALFSELWSMVKDTTFIYNGLKYSNTEQKSIEDQFIECAWDCFKKINRTIIAKQSDYDTIQKKATALMKGSFQWGKTGDWKPVKGLGTETVKTPDELIDLLMCTWHKPIDISFLRWNPEEWYPQLTCPVLFLFAENDKIIDLEGSVANIRRIKEQYMKSNFSIHIIKGCGHSFDYYYMKKGEGMRRKVISEKPFNELSNWFISHFN